MGPRSNKKGKKYVPKVKGRSLGRPKLSSMAVPVSILIVCEDEKSSYLYFQKFRQELGLPSVNVEVCGPECGSAPISVVDFAKERRDSVSTSPVRDDYDHVFCVIDADVPTTLAQAIDKATANKLRVILSNPCFEYWYILHFRRTSALYHRSRDVVSDLKKDFPNYNKGNADIFEEIYPKRKTAIANSKGVLRSHWHGEADLRKCNPSTHVYQVVECIMDIAEKSRFRRGK